MAARDGRSDFEAYKAARTARIPLGRRSDPDEMARMVVWLATEAPDYMTAERLNDPNGAVQLARAQTSADLFREYRLYIACEADEDIPYIAKYTGADHLLIGSDYPHSDPSREDQFVNVLNTREDLSPQLRQKIMYDNPRAFYGL